MRTSLKLLKQSFLINVWLIAVCGLAYPLALTGLAQVFFKSQADGSLLRREGKVIGSQLLGQEFVEAKYFHGRPSGDANLGPTSRALMERVQTDVARERAAESRGDLVPGDLATASGSGLDPHISPAAALWQVPSVLKARPRLSERTLLALIQEHTQTRTWGVLGEPRVNVLTLNLALDNLY